MNWTLLEALGNTNFSVMEFGVGSRIVTRFKGSKNEMIEFEGICTAVKAKSPCVSYTIKKCYADVCVERKLNYLALPPKIKLRTKIVKKVALKRAKF